MSFVVRGTSAIVFQFITKMNFRLPDIECVVNEPKHVRAADVLAL